MINPGSREDIGNFTSRTSTLVNTLTKRAWHSLPPPHSPMFQLESACPTSPTPFSVKPIGASARCIDGLSCALNLFQRQLQLRKLLSLLGDHLQPGSQPGSPRPTPGGQVGAQPCLPVGAQHSPRGIEASTFLAAFRRSCGRQIELWVSPRKSDPMHARMASSPRLAHHHRSTT